MEHTRKCRKIAFVNGKGGCGKTTSLFNIAGVLSSRGDKVLVVDLDKQRNTTDTLLMNAEKPVRTVYDFFVGTADLSETIGKALFQKRGNSKPRYYNVDCVVSSVQLENEQALQTVSLDYVRESFDELIRSNGYDWVLVDMPPSSKILNHICFSSIVDYTIIPFSSDIYSVSGYGDIMSTIDEARTENPSLNVLGVFLSRYMGNCAVDRYIKSQLESFSTFMQTQIPLSADIREAVMFGRPISYYRIKSKSKAAYEKLVDELTDRIDN